ncbi:hypothetical protein [Massilia frigida]|nr:hypothetical protein [Massilia frigida]
MMMIGAGATLAAFGVALFSTKAMTVMPLIPRALTVPTIHLTMVT